MSRNTQMLFADTFATESKIISKYKDAKEYIEDTISFCNAYSGKLVKGIDYPEKYKIIDFIMNFFKELPMSVEVESDNGYSIRNIKRISKDDMTKIYRFTLIVSDPALDNFIQTSIKTQLDPNFTYTLINEFLKRFINGLPFGKYNKNFDIRAVRLYAKNTVYDYFYQISSCDTDSGGGNNIILFCKREISTIRALQAIGKLYFDSEAFRIITNSIDVCNWIIDGSSAKYLDGDTIYISLPNNIEKGFIHYLNLLYTNNTLLSLVEQAINIIIKREQ